MKINHAKLTNQTLKVFFYVAFYYSSVVIYLTYSIIDSPDFGKYLDILSIILETFLR